MAFRQYTAYDIRSSVARSDTEATQFLEFQGNILKYSNDGAFYTDTENELIWNQTYEMSEPKVDMCEEYLTIYDKKGTQIYILTSSELQGSIETTMPIDQVCVAAQGTVAVLMRKGDTAYLELYDKEGKKLARGEIHGEKGGYPIAIALSHDALKLGVSMLDIADGKVKSTVAFYNYGSVGQNEIDKGGYPIAIALSHDALKLGVSMLDIADGKVKSTVAFYNYGSVGQNEIDNCVGVTTYEDMVIPELEFTSNDRMIAFGDTKLLVFEGTQKPQQKAEIVLEQQARSIFHNENYIGIVTDNEDEAAEHHLRVYRVNGDMVMEKNFGMEYDSIEFLSNDEICIRTENICDLYTLRGVYKFHYEFDRELYQVIPGDAGLNYTFVLKDATERVRLK